MMLLSLPLLGGWDLLLRSAVDDTARPLWNPLATNLPMGEYLPSLLSSMGYLVASIVGWSILPNLYL